MLLAGLVFVIVVGLMAYGVFGLLEALEQKLQCPQVLGGIANKQCQLPPGHSGPHITQWQGQTYWFETGTRIELLDKR